MLVVVLAGLFCKAPTASAAYERYVTTFDNFIDDYPNGRSNLRHHIYNIYDDGTMTYDFWAVKSIHQTVPGAVLAGNY